MLLRTCGHETRGRAGREGHTREELVGGGGGEEGYLLSSMP